MYVILLVLGLLLALAGVVAIGLGIPIQEFGLGNTLIMAGTVALTGGLILVGLAMVVRQLRRLLDATRALNTSAGLVPEPYDPGYAVGPERPRPEPVSQRPEPVAKTSEPAWAPTAEAPAPGASLPPLVALASGTIETELPPPADEDEQPEREPEREPEPVPQAVQEPAPERRPRSAAMQDFARGMTFDNVWSDEAAAAEPVPPASPRTDVLKSGVIGGMPYTLYADGSIEAELSTGTMRFASFTELRDFIERSRSES
jgi:hypothetical protein